MKTINSSVFALVVALLARGALSAEPAPVKCTFDLSAVVSPPAREVVEKRLRVGLVRELRGEADSSVGNLHLVAAFVKGRLLCRVLLAYFDGPHRHIASIPISNVGDLTAIANAQASSQRLWIGRLIATKVGSKETKIWTVQCLMPRAPSYQVLTMPGRGGVWKLQKQTPGAPPGQYLVERHRGPEPKPGDVLVARWTVKSTIGLTVKEGKIPLSGMQIYAQHGSYPDEHPVRLRKRAPVSATNDNGKALFRSDKPEPVFLLIAQSRVPLLRFVVAPTDPTFADAVKIAYLWYLPDKDGKGGKMVPRGVYVGEMTEIIDIKIKEQEVLMKFLNRVLSLLKDGKLEDAERAIREFSATYPKLAARPAVKEIVAKIAVAKAKGNVATLEAKAKLAMAVKDYDTAIKCLQEALAMPNIPAGKKSQLESLLRQCKKEAKDLEDRLKDAKELLFKQLPAKSAVEIVATIDKIEAAVVVLCEGRQVSSLQQADKQLGAALTLVNKENMKVQTDLKAEKITRADADAPLKRLGKATKQLIHCRELISEAMNRVKLAG